MSQMTAYGTSSDACIQSSVSSTYSTCRTETVGGGGVLPDPSTNTLVIGQRNVSPSYLIHRSYLFFNTSSLTNNCIITSATLSIFGEVDKSDVDFNIVIQNGQPTYPSSPVVDSDYNYSYYQYSSNGGQISTVDFNIGGFNTNIPLNGNGILWINKTGVTKFCLRSSKDIDGTAPSANTSEYVEFWGQQKGGNYIPYLTISYTAIPAVPSKFSMKF